MGRFWLEVRGEARPPGSSTETSQPTPIAIGSSRNHRLDPWLKAPRAGKEASQTHEGFHQGIALSRDWKILSGLQQIVSQIPQLRRPPPPGCPVSSLRLSRKTSPLVALSHDPDRSIQWRHKENAPRSTGAMLRIKAPETPWPWLPVRRPAQLSCHGENGHHLHRISRSVLRCHLL